MKCRLPNTEAELRAAREFAEVLFEKIINCPPKGGPRSKSFPEQGDEDAKAMAWLPPDRGCFLFFFRSEAVRDDSGSVHE